MVQIKIVRHSERLDYSYPLYWMFCFGQFWADTPLTYNGYKMAYEKGKGFLSDDFNPKHIYTSPYTRTMATATEIKKSFPQCEIIIEPLLAEYQPYIKHTINLYNKGIPTIYDGSETDFSYPESYENFSKRVQFIISKLIEKHDTDLIIITHGEILKVFISYLQNLFPDIFLDPGTTPYLTTLSFDFDKNNKVIDEKSIKLE